MLMYGGGPGEHPKVQKLVNKLDAFLNSEKPGNALKTGNSDKVEAEMGGPVIMVHNNFYGILLQETSVTNIWRKM